MSEAEPKLCRRYVRTLSAHSSYGGEQCRFEVTSDFGCGYDWLKIRVTGDNNGEIMIPYDLQPLLAEAIMDARESSERDSVDIEDEVTCATDGLANQIAEYLDAFGYIGTEELQRLKSNFPNVLTAILRDRKVWLWQCETDGREDTPIE